MISLDYREVKPVYLKIEDYLIRLIQTHALIPGDLLPPVREIASRNAVNPVAINQALDNLEHKGYIKRINNRYMVVDRGNTEEVEELLSKLDAIVAGLVERKYPIEDITDRIRGKE